MQFLRNSPSMASVTQLPASNTLTFIYGLGGIADVASFSLLDLSTIIKLPNLYSSLLVQDFVVPLIKFSVLYTVQLPFVSPEYLEPAVIDNVEKHIPSPPLS